MHSSPTHNFTKHSLSALQRLQTYRTILPSDNLLLTFFFFHFLTHLRLTKLSMLDLNKFKFALCNDNRYVEKH